MAQPRRKHEDIEQRLDAINWSEPSKSRPVEEPQTHRPPPPPRPPRYDPSAPSAPEPEDPYELVKEKFKVNLFELLHWQVPLQGEGEIRRGDHASYYLVLDKCFEALFTGRLKSLGFEPLDGKTQMMYMYFYWESYGKGYETCPLGNAELQKQTSPRFPRHIWPSSTEAATRPNKEHHNSLGFPFLYLALAIYAENDRNEGCTMFKGREKVPVLVDKGN